jgi:hypothetical protein
MAKQMLGLLGHGGFASHSILESYLFCVGSTQLSSLRTYERMESDPLVRQFVYVCLQERDRIRADVEQLASGGGRRSQVAQEARCCDGYIA